MRFYLEFKKKMNGINVKWLDTSIAYFIAAYFVIYNLLSRNINIPQWFQVPFHNHEDKNALNYIYCIKLTAIRKVTNISGFIASKPLSDLTEFFQQVDNKNLFRNIFQETMILFEEWTSFFFQNTWQFIAQSCSVQFQHSFSWTTLA